jgi:type IX secretion system PorP/SprF family membrane protein
MMSRLTIISFFIAACSMLAAGQDIHFSQFSLSPANLNPATAGVNISDFRVVYNYRNQWKSISSPYLSHAISFDMPFMEDQITNGAFAGGISFLSDKAGDLNFGTTQINLTLAANKNVNRDNNISVGIQGGFVQRALNGDLEAQQWDNEYDPNYSGGYLNDQATGAGIENLSYGDFATGIQWTYDGGVPLRANAGLSLFHLNKPKHSIIGAAEKLNAKLVFHGGADIELNQELLRLIPQFLFLKQGPQIETNIGGMVKFRLQEASIYTGEIREAAISLGGWYRFGDAFIPTLRIDFMSIIVGISYDITLSDINVAAESRGGMEFSVTYLHPFPPFKRTASPLM